MGCVACDGGGRMVEQVMTGRRPVYKWEQRFEKDKEEKGGEERATMRSASHSPRGETASGGEGWRRSRRWRHRPRFPGGDSMRLI